MANKLHPAANVLFSSATVEWPTSRAVYERLHQEFHFTLDPCMINSGENGLAALFCRWDGHRVFVNPPYGRDIRKWLERWKEAELAVYLLPARTDTFWFHEICLKHAREIRYVRRRLKFGNAEHAAPFPSILVVFRKE